jgi:uncharacterized membrane protein YqjE
MAHQTVRNGPVASRDRQNNGVIEGVSSFGTDLAALAMLQARLAACDLRDSTRQAIPSLVGMIAFGTIGVACTVVGLAGLALWLAEVFQARTGIVMMVVALAGLVIAGIASVFLARSLVSSFSYFRRSQEELDRNLAWIKTTLVHSGR